MKYSATTKNIAVKVVGETYGQQGHPCPQTVRTTEQIQYIEYYVGADCCYTFEDLQSGVPV